MCEKMLARLAILCADGRVSLDTDDPKGYTNMRRWIIGMQRACDAKLFVIRQMAMDRESER
jgi:hypothetical protein